jgi:hypothetical protein
VIISNTTPLINFACIRRLDILTKLFPQVYIPNAVREELQNKIQKFPTISNILEYDFIKTLEIKNTQLVNSLRIDLHLGEAEAIVLAIENPNSFLLLDELAGRSIARFQNLKFTGTIGCLLEAKRENIISEIKPFLDSIQLNGNFWISQGLYTQVLRDAKE